MKSMRVDAVSLWPGPGHPNAASEPTRKLPQARIAERNDGVRLAIEKNHVERATLPSDVVGWFVYVSRLAEITDDAGRTETCMCPVYEGNVVAHKPDATISGRTHLYCEPGKYIDPR